MGIDGLNFEQLQAKQIAGVRRSFADWVKVYRDMPQEERDLLSSLVDEEAAGLPMSKEQWAIVLSLARLSYRTVAALYVQQLQSESDDHREAGT
jgi:Lon protease-like protein